MKKIILLPLDERPCNFDFPDKLFHSADLELIRPEHLGNKKTPADAQKIIEFLKLKSRDADALILSVDTLLYGGLIPSRLHHLDYDTVNQRFEVISELKRENPKLFIYAFQCIMRCPSYSSSEEEPDYYETYGEKIHKLGVLLHKEKLGKDLPGERKALLESVDRNILDDYINRRNFNREFNLKTIDLVKSGVIDFLIVPQDDSAAYGYTAMDQEIVRERIMSELLQDKVLIYPGADEIGLTLMSRAVNRMNGKRPRVYLKYSSIHAPFIIPAYEDRALGETIKYQLMAANCRITDSYETADFCLAVNCPANHMMESEDQPVKNRDYQVERNIMEFAEFLEDCVNDQKAVTVGDIAFANGGDLELIALMNKRKLLDQMTGYAGWNTSSNTLGTAIAQGVHYLYYGKSKKHMDFLILRYVEDGGYGGMVRTYVAKQLLPKYDMDYFDVKTPDGKASQLVRDNLQMFIENNLDSIAGNIRLNKVVMPWRRMFEVGIDVEYCSSIVNS